MNYLSQTNPAEFTGKRVIVRADFDVSIEDGTVVESEAFRIDSTIPTLMLLKNAGAKIIVIAHIGREGKSLEPVAEFISENVPELGLQFIPQLIGDKVTTAIAEMQNGDCILLENLRQNPGEEKNDPELAKTLASYGDIFIENAFGNSHRNHASMVGIAKLLPSYCGLVPEQEINYLNHALKPESPSVLIMAGIKFETKLPLIEKLLPLYDSVILGGGLLNTYLKSLGINIGKSVTDETANLASIMNNPKIVIPEQVIIEQNGTDLTVKTDEVLDGDVIVDVIIDEKMKQIIHTAKTLVWNGPLGWYEKGYMQSSLDAISSFGPETQSIVGGGDTVTVIRKEHLENKVSFLSTGGGAMLEYLQQGTLPGIEALH